MFRRKYQRKSGLTRTLVALLALVMLASVCFPAMRVSAEEVDAVPDGEVQSGVFEQLLEKIEEAEENTALTAENISALGKEISDAYNNGTLDDDQYKTLSEKFTGLTASGDGSDKSGNQEEIPGTSSENATESSKSTEGSEIVTESTAVISESTTATVNAPADEETEDLVQKLFERLLGTSTYDELSKMMDGMTEEEWELYNNKFTDEQKAQLQSHVYGLSEEEVETLAVLTVKQGETATFPGVERNNYEFKIYRNGAEVSSQVCGITPSNLGNNTIQVQTSASTPVGEYTISYGHTERFLFWSQFVQDGTITLEVIEQTSPDAPVVDNKKMTYEKTVTAKADGTYDLSLTLSGAVGTQTNPAKVDIVLVIDKSGSMDGQRLSDAKSAASTLIDALDQNSAIDARYNIVAFSGSSSYSNNLIQRSTSASGWTALAASAKTSVNNISAGGGTNYEAGLLRAQEQLGSARAGAAKIVVFLTDGLPTLRCSNYVWYDGSGYGNGQDDDRGRNINAAVTAVGKIAMNRFYAIGTGEASTDTLNKLTNGATLANEKKPLLVDSADLEKVFDDIAAEISTFLCDNVTITDTLHHVDGELMVKVTNPESVTVKVTKTDGTPVAGPAKTVTLSATTINVSAELTATYHDTTGVLKLEFPSAYKLEPDYVYTLSAVIEPTEKAYQLYRENGYTDLADSGTGTHSGDYGFYSNDSATVTYTYNGAPGTETYSHPVVQLNPGKLILTKKITGLSGEDLSSLQSKLSFDVTITYPDQNAETVDVPFTLFTDSDGDGVYTFELNRLSPNTQFTVTESNADVDGYTVETKINTVVDEDKSTSGTVAKDETVTVAYENVYSPSTTTVSVTKTVSGNMGDDKAEFPFTVSLKDASGNDLSMRGITYTIYQKGSDGEYAEVSGGSGTINADTYTFGLKHDQKIIFAGVKIGASITVSESTSYTATYMIDNGSVQTGASATFPVTKDGNTVAFNNNKSANIDTGITMDSVPYVLLLAMAVIGGGVLLSKRRVY